MLLYIFDYFILVHNVLNLHSKATLLITCILFIYLIALSVSQTIYHRRVLTNYTVNAFTKLVF
jgi:hypothetical protein